MRIRLSALVAGAAAICGSAILSMPVMAQDRADPTFASGQSLLSEGNSLFTVAVDPDGKAATIYFAGLVNELDGVGAPLFATRTFSVAIPLTGTKQGTKLRLAVGGYIARSREADISLMTIVNGQPYILDFAKVTSAPGATISTDDCSKFGSPPKEGSMSRYIHVSGLMLGLVLAGSAVAQSQSAASIVAAAEIPTFELMGFPITAVQVQVVGPRSPWAACRPLRIRSLS
jgi:hypothetical protein